MTPCLLKQGLHYANLCCSLNCKTWHCLTLTRKEKVFCPGSFIRTEQTFFCKILSRFWLGGGTFGLTAGKLCPSPNWYIRSCSYIHVDVGRDLSCMQIFSPRELFLGFLQYQFNTVETTKSSGENRCSKVQNTYCCEAFRIGSRHPECNVSESEVRVSVTLSEPVSERKRMTYKDACTNCLIIHTLNTIMHMYVCIYL